MGNVELLFLWLLPPPDSLCLWDRGHVSHNFNVSRLLMDDSRSTSEALAPDDETDDDQDDEKEDDQSCGATSTALPCGLGVVGCVARRLV